MCCFSSWFSAAPERLQPALVLFHIACAHAIGPLWARPQTPTPTAPPHGMDRLEYSSFAPEVKGPDECDYPVGKCLGRCYLIEDTCLCHSEVTDVGIQLETTA